MRCRSPIPAWVRRRNAVNTAKTRQPCNRKAACTPKTMCRLLFHLIHMLFGSKSALFGCCKNRCNTAASAGFSCPVCHSPMK